jgi:integrase
MASVRRLKTGKYLCEVRRIGYAAQSKTFLSRLEAQAWGVEVERQLGHGVQAATRTLGEAMQKYASEVSPTHKGERWERIRIQALLNDPVCKVMLPALTTDRMQQWIDQRKQRVSGATVLRELTLLSAIINVARKQWKWCTHNPVTDTRKPREAPARNRRIQTAEIALLLESLGYQEGKAPVTMRHYIAVAMLLSIETAMRQSELWGVTWEHVHVAQRFLHLPDTKNGEPRNVPLSAKALALIALLPRSRHDDRLIPFAQASCATVFRRACALAGIADLHWHDFRHHAVTEMAKKLMPLQLAKITGHKDLRQLQAYYDATASELAALLD